jgi:cation transport regulator ChaC
MSDIWIFGYGSLIWRPDFPHREARVADLVGWARRFWQGSTDHRGVPGAPGRVVTLVPAAGETCRGMAYRVAAAEREAVMANLDHREKGGYCRIDADLVLAPGVESVPGIAYLANPENPNYLGPAPLAAIAAQVRASHGPSGANLDYVLRLAQALRAIGAEDAHVYELAQMVEEG